VTDPAKSRAAATRTALARALLPRLRVGSALPSSARLARLLGCSRPAAWRHLTHAMAGAGVVLASLPRHRGKPRLVVRQLPVMR
jgi:DNA-binding FadR family transcriptional regulator